MYLGPYNVGRFGQMGVLANRPEMDQFLTFSNNFLYKIKI